MATKKTPPPPKALVPVGPPVTYGSDGKPRRQWYEYRHIEAWGIGLASHWPYVEREMRRAAEEGAPIDAIYKHSGGKWRRAQDLQPGHEHFTVFANMLRGNARVAFKPSSIKTPPETN